MVSFSPGVWLEILFVICASNRADPGGKAKLNDYGLRSGMLRTRGSGPFAHNLAGLLVLAQPQEDGLAKVAVPGPFRKANLADQARFAPRAPLHFGGRHTEAAPLGSRRWQVDKWAGGADQLLEAVVKRLEGSVIKSGADLGGEHELVAFVVADQNRAEIGTRTFRLGVTADDKFLFQAPLEFHPGAASPPRFVAGIALLGDEAFETARLHLAHDTRRIRLDARGEPDLLRSVDDQFLQHLLAPHERQIAQVSSFQVQQIERIVEDARFVFHQVVSLKQLKVRAP